MFRYRLAQNFAPSKVKLVIGQVSAELKVSPHPLFDQAQKIFIKKDELNLKCLEILQKGQVDITPQKSSQFVKRCRSTYSIEPQLIVEEVGLSIMLSNNEQELKNLDYIEFNDLLSVIKIGFDRTAVKLHPKILRKIKSYIQNCKRTQSQKNIISQIVRSFKQNQKIQDDEQQGVQIKKEVQRQNKTTNYKESAKTQFKMTQEQSQKPAKEQTSRQYVLTGTENRKQKRQNQRMIREQEREDEKQQKQERFLQATSPYQNKQSSNKQKWQNNKRQGGQGGRSIDKRSNDKYGRQESKEKYDPKVLLGISGDTEAGWRERNRPPRVPAYKQNTDNNYKHSGNQRKQWKKQDKSNTYATKRQTQNQSSSQSQQVFKPIVKQNPPNTSSVTSPVKPASQGSKTIDNGSYTLSFTYPADGNQFNFGTVKDNFKILVNDSFWITFSKGNLEIKKGENGYARQSKIDVISNGFMAEGLTLNLEGYSNIEDGGDTLGNPNIQDFTGSQKQFFHVNKLEVYSGEQDKNSRGATPVASTKVADVKDFGQDQYQQPQNYKQARDNIKTSSKQQEEEQQQNEPYQKKKQKKSFKSERQDKADKGDKSRKNKKQNYKNKQDDSFDVDSENVRKISNVSSTNSKKQRKQKKQIRRAQQKGAEGQQNQDDWQDVDQKSQRSQASNASNKSGSRRGKKQRQIRQKYQKEQRQFGGHENQLKPDDAKPSRNKRTDNRSRSKSNSRSKYEQKGKSRDKIKYDPKILLGINGNTEQGWRQVNRPSKAPSRSQLSPGGQQDDENDEPRRQKPRSPRKYTQKQQEKQSQPKQSSAKPVEVKQQSVNKSVDDKYLKGYKLLFSYPKDGKSFDFNQIKDNFKMFVNDSFWINFKNENLQILKGDDGYTRESKIDVMKDSFMANGLTVSLDGSSNIQDGGQQIGSPQIEQFTKNKSQFFHIDSLSIYVPISK